MRGNAVKLDFPEHVRAHPGIRVSLTKPAISELPALKEEIPPNVESFEIDERRQQLYQEREILSHQKRGRGYQWLTLFESTPNHEAERQPTKGFVNLYGSLTKPFATTYNDVAIYLTF